MKRRPFIRKGALWLTGTAAGLNIIVPKVEASSIRRAIMMSRQVSGGGGGGSLAIANRANSGASLSDPTNVSSFTVTAVSPMIVAITGDNSVTISGVTWNTSESLSLITSASIADGSAVTKVWLYGLKNPTATTANVSVDFSAAPATVGTVVHVIGTTGGDTTTGWRSAYTRNDVTGAGPGLTVVDSQNGDIVFHAAAIYAAATITFDGGETTTNTEVENVFGQFSCGLSTKAATGANTAVGCTDGGTYCEVAVAIIPAP